MRIVGSHSPGGRIIAFWRNSSKPAIRSSRSRARYAMIWKISSDMSVPKQRPISRACDVGTTTAFSFDVRLGVDFDLIFFPSPAAPAPGPATLSELLPFPAFALALLSIALPLWPSFPLAEMAPPSDAAAVLMEGGGAWELGGSRYRQMKRVPMGTSAMPLKGFANRMNAMNGRSSSGTSPTRMFMASELSASFLKKLWSYYKKNE